MLKIIRKYLHSRHFARKSFTSILSATNVRSPFREEKFDQSKKIEEKATFFIEPENTKENIQDDIQGLKLSIEKLEKLVDEGKSHENDNWESDREKRRQRMEKSTKLGGAILLGFFIIGGFSFALYYGRAKRDENGSIIEDQFSGSILAPFYRINQNIWKWRDYIVEPAREKLLPDPLPPPYLQPKYTLVLEMKNLLITPQWTYKTGHRFLKRPGLDYFLNVVGYPNFEVVIYTGESPSSVVEVSHSLDPNQRIMYRLFRDTTKYENGHHKKDLSKLNRDLSKVIYIDVDAVSGSLNPENLLLLPEWKGNLDDTSLIDLAELLKAIYVSNVEDVRPVIQYYSKFSDPIAEFKRRAIYMSQQKENENKVHEEPKPRKYSGHLFGFRRHQII